jgi:Domain of unknown function (DUF4124)
MNRKYPLQLLLLLVAVMPAVTASAGVYRWVDENGRVHFGDRPSAGADTSDEVMIRKQAPSSAPNNVDRRQLRERLLEQYQRERDEKKQQAEKQRQQKQKQKQRCAYARTRLSEYLEHGALYDRLPNQKRRYLTDQERDAEIAKARKEVKKWCK